MFSTFEPIETGENVFMGNSPTSEIKGPRKSGLEDNFWEGVDSEQYPVCA